MENVETIEKLKNLLIGIGFVETNENKFSKELLEIKIDGLNISYGYFLGSSYTFGTYDVLDMLNRFYKKEIRSYKIRKLMK